MSHDRQTMIEQGWMDPYMEGVQKHNAYLNIRQRECNECFSRKCIILKGDFSIVIYTKEYEELEKCLTSCANCSMGYEVISYQTGNELENEGKTAEFMRKELYEVARHTLPWKDYYNEMEDHPL